MRTTAARAGSRSRRTRRTTGTRSGWSRRAMHFHRLAPNIQVKFPTTAAGLVAIEEATAQGVVINATVAFTVSQALAVGEAVDRGIRRFEAAGGDASRFSPVCSLMVGRLDDWVKVLVERDDIALDPAAAELGGDRGLQARVRALPGARLPDAAARGGVPPPAALDGARGRRRRAHDPARVAGPVQRQRHRARVTDRRPGRPGIRRRAPGPRPGLPARVRAGRPDVDEFDTFGPTARTLRSFVEGYHALRDRSATSCSRTRTSGAADRRYLRMAKASMSRRPGPTFTTGSCVRTCR